MDKPIVGYIGSHFIILLMFTYMLSVPYISAQQEQVRISGERGIRMEVNTTSNFGVSVYRELESAATSPPATGTTPGNGITTAEPQPDTPTVPDKTGSINVRVIGLREKDNASRPITAGGHSVLQNELMSRSYSQVSIYQASLSAEKSVQATCSQFHIKPVSGLAPKGALNVTICSLKSNSTISRSASGEHGSPVTEDVDVLEGQMWMSVMVSSWEWCSKCQQVGDRNISGEYLAVDLDIRVQDNRGITGGQVLQGKPAHYNLGFDSYMDLSTMVQIDGKTQRMSAGSLSSTPDTNWWTVLSVTLPRFKTSATFWQIIDPGNLPNYTEDKEVGVEVGGATKVSTVSTHLIGLAAIFAILWATVIMKI